ncbi:class I SAM-dependent methyltransferase [Tenacibaculum sp. E3R01]|uniref:class I SAM-dependent methyltransferase n=1 Tax=Tenacibaculum sp. E3R01 TaxID=2267227 RepID=UPI000DEBC5B4|nr:class I SAM-dependent methyltransferase [Tenacibaculum sp. E3R01]RBW56566.1 class I SAM-dependent methyltransferase [Tenacibaculum sp. E3R01]
MNKYILNNDVQSFINNNLKSNIDKLLFKGSPFKQVTIQELANQIIAKQKSEKKLPTWFNTSTIYYPAKLSIEQTSSEITAEYKSYIVKGKTIIDITGGFGVDTYYFSKIFENVIHCEINEELSKIVNYNYLQLGVENVHTIPKNGIEYLKETSEKVDCIYIDPSRRNDAKGKVFLLKDCLPNVPDNLDFLFSKSDIILIKNSPILDISATINELKYVKEIHIIAVKNEVKELVFLLEKNHNKNTEIKTHNFLINKKKQAFNFSFNSISKAIFNLPLNFLYEPNSAVLKSGGFNQISSYYKLDKLHQHSHLYTSEFLKENFPGRTFLIEKFFKYNKKRIRKEILDEQANITIRNFPKTVAQLRKETKLKDGGNIYLFFTTNFNNEPIVIKCKKIK